MKDKQIDDFLSKITGELAKEILRLIIFEHPIVRVNVEEMIKQINKEARNDTKGN